jgi:hypothetical protein
MNDWELIFMQSPANSGHYEEDELPQANWSWPKETWFQNRLDLVRGHASFKSSQRSRDDLPKM